MRTVMPSLEPGTCVVLHGHPRKVGSMSDDGVVSLTSTIYGDTVRLPLSALGKAHLQGNFRPMHAPVAPVSDKVDFSSQLLTEEQRERVARRTAYVHGVRTLLPIGPKNSRFVDQVRDIARRTADPAPPSPHSVYRWARRYVQSGYDSRVLMMDAGVRRERTKRVDAAVTDLLQQHLETLLSARGSTIHGVTDEALALTARDTGFHTFIDKRGQEHFVEEFLAISKQPGKRAT